MTNDQRLDRAERLLTLMVNAGRRERTHTRESVRELDEKITMLIDSQIRTDDELRKMRAQSEAIREEAKAMRDDLYRRSAEIFQLFRLTDQRIAILTDAQTLITRQLSALIERDNN